ncbi:MAG: hypothetical protein KGK14_08200 [Bacteroidota bacterium]|jgi:hypothetical protein|nr:hypothetical protein [Bacteroidota bacterium]
MAINKNHEFEDLNGVKCAIVERNISAERVIFLKNLLVHNGYTVIVVESVPVKTNSDETSMSAVEQPALYTLGVTDVTFNVTNAIFGRLLKTEDGTIVTLAYWQQSDLIAHDDIPYFANNNCMN